MDTPNASSRRRWLLPASLVGAAYLVAGLTFGVLAGAAPSHQMRVAWRLAAWVVSAAVFAAQIGYEHFRLRSSRRAAAAHASLAAAAGAFALAAAANVHAFWAATGHHRALALALVIWPIATAVPAFVVAFAAAAALAFARRGAPAPRGRG